MSVPIDRASLKLLDAKRRESAPHELSHAWSIALITLVLYGSLIPFDFDASTLRASNGFGLLNIRFCSTTAEDVLTNLFVYMAVGLALTLCGRRPGHAVYRVIRALAIGCGVSVLAESLQTSLAVRVASWTDVALNVAGVIIGVVVAPCVERAVSAGTRWARDRLEQRPFSTLAAILIFGLFVHGLAPFDFITSTDDLHSAFHRAGSLLAVRHAPNVQAEGLAAVTSEIPGAVWFGVLGYLLGLSARRSGRDAITALGSSIQTGVIVAGLVEALQLFTRSHEFEPDAMILHWLAVLLGAWSAILVANDSSAKDGRRFPSTNAPVLPIAGLAIVQVLLLLVDALLPASLTWPSMDPSRIHWLAFESLWRRPMPVALVEACSSLLTFATLALTVVLLLRSLGLKRVWRATAAIVMLTAAGVQLLQLCTVSRTADITGPILAMFSLLGLWRLTLMIGPARPLRLSDAVRPQSADPAPMAYT